jgi:AraC-like DNA-binding protein
MRPWYFERPPASPLAGELACTWTADVGGDTRTLIPDACLDVLWVDDGSLFLCGPETTAWTFTLPPSTAAVGVRFRPGVAPGVLGLDASELRNTRVRLEQLWGDGPTRRLSGRIADAPSPDARVAVLQDALGHRIVEATPTDPVVAEVADAAAGTGERSSVADLARTVGLSERQLRRRCSAAFGYGPAVLARILRVQRFLALTRRHGTAAGLAQLALAAGYADQPHLSREVRAIAGTTPAAIASDPFKTPAPPSETMGP